MSKITLKITDPKQSTRALELLSGKQGLITALTVKGAGTLQAEGPDKEMESLQYDIGALFEEAGFDSYILEVKVDRTIEDVEADQAALAITIIRDLGDVSELTKIYKLIELDPDMTVSTAAIILRGAQHGNK